MAKGKHAKDSKIPFPSFIKQHWIIITVILLAFGVGFYMASNHVLQSQVSKPQINKSYFTKAKLAEVEKVMNQSNIKVSSTELSGKKNMTAFAKKFVDTVTNMADAGKLFGSNMHPGDFGKLGYRYYEDKNELWFVIPDNYNDASESVLSDMELKITRTFYGLWVYNFLRKAADGTDYVAYKYPDHIYIVQENNDGHYKGVKVSYHGDDQPFQREYVEGDY